MAKPIPPDRLEAVFGAVSAFPNGCTLFQVAAKLTPIAPLRNVQRWLGVLVREGRIVRVGATHTVRYKLPDGDAEEAISIASREGQAIQVLVNQPLVDRASADYRRVALDAYRPNQAYWIPAAIRARFGVAGGAVTWREPAALNRVVANLA